MAKEDWTPERVELAKRLWKDGYSAARIARELACGISRNAVIGKMIRMGVTGGTPVPRKPDFGIARGQKPQTPKPYIPPPPPQDAPAPLGEARQFLPTGQCKWIHGEIGGAWQMCGHQVHRPESPWCLFHWHRAIAKKQEVA